MRDIKFRVWDGKKMKQATLLGLHWELDNNPCTYVNKADSQNLLYFDDSFPMQYTGIKDCKDQEVYEGDILCYPDPDGMVEYNQFWPVSFEDGVFVVNNSAIWDYLNDSNTKLEELEVVGNIYENEDLLK